MVNQTQDNKNEMIEKTSHEENHVELMTDTDVITHKTSPQTLYKTDTSSSYLSKMRYLRSDYDTRVNSKYNKLISEMCQFIYTYILGPRNINRKKTIDLTDRQIQRSLTQLKRKRELIKAHRTKAESIMLRKEWLEHQNRKNYQLEYDRIVGHINSGRVSGTTTDMLKKREEHFKKMGGGERYGTNSRHDLI